MKSSSGLSDAEHTALATQITPYASLYAGPIIFLLAGVVLSRNRTRARAKSLILSFAVFTTTLELLLTTIGSISLQTKGIYLASWVLKFIALWLAHLRAATPSEPADSPQA